jgi:hypothetical protein
MLYHGGKSEAQMSRYDLLRDYLERQSADRIQLSFRDIEDEDRIGLKLPRSAKEKQAWWANETNPTTRHYQCRAWRSAGWKVEYVDLNREIVIFMRMR